MLEHLRLNPTNVLKVDNPLRSNSSEQPMFKSIFDIVSRRRLLLISCLILALSFDAAYIKLVRAKYAATVTLLIDFRRAQLSQTDVAIVDQGAVDSQIELLRSEKILLAVVKKLNLVQDPEFNRNILSEADLAADPSAADLAIRRVISTINDNLSVSRVGKSYLVGVTFKSTDPFKAARIANEVADEYTVDQIDSKVQVTKDENAWLATQVSELRERATGAYKSVQDFKMGHDINPLRDLDAEKAVLALAAQVADARGVSSGLAERLSRATRLLASSGKGQNQMPEVPVLQAFHDKSLEGLIVSWVQANSQLKSTAEDQDKKPGVDQINERISNLVRDIWDRIAVMAQQSRSDWIAAYATQQALENRLSDAKAKASVTRDAEGRLGQLETSAATSRSLYESYLNQLTNAARRQTVPSSDARVISAASVPLLPTWPKRPLLVVISIVCGISLGLAISFALDSLDETVRTRRRLEETLGLNCLGVIPGVPSWRRSSSSDAKGWLVNYDPARGVDPIPRRSARKPKNYIRAAAVLRRLGFLASVSGSPGGVVGVTSAVAGEGKSTVAVNMALCSVNTGSKVLLVDCNVLHPTITMAVTQDGELERVNAGDIFGLGNVVRLESGLEVLPLPPVDGFDRADLPDIRFLRDILHEARAAYDLVVVDLPAILPHSGLVAIAHMLDVIILVTRWGVTKSPQVERAVSSMGISDRMLGFVLNCVDLDAIRRFEGSLHSSYADLG